MNQNKLFIKLNTDSLDELLQLQTDKPNALTILLVVLKRTNRKSGSCMIGYTDFQNWMTQKEYRNAKEYLERKNIVSFTGTKAGTIARISNKIFDMNIEGRDRGRERAELENLEDSVIIEDLPLQKNELEQKGQSNGRLTKNILKNKEYNINNYNYNNKYIGSRIKKFFPEYNKILTNF